MENGYRMLKDYAETFFIEKKSKFISYAKPVYSEDEALEFLASIRKKHYDATHNCYAYILGESMNIQRSSDDGEPSGTAGVPILEVMKKEQITNSIIIVTRYFGGILLGAGGLIRAYTEGAANGIKAAGTVRVQPFSISRVTIDYSFLSKLQYEIPRKKYLLQDTEYLDTVKMHILTSPKDAEQLKSDVAEWTNGSGKVEYLGDEMLKVDETTNELIK